MLVEQFLTGLPRRFSSQLCAASSAADPTLSLLTKQVRALFAAVDEPVATAFTAAVVGSEESRVCYSCSATGHRFIVSSVSNLATSSGTVLRLWRNRKDNRMSEPVPPHPWCLPTQLVR